MVTGVLILLGMLSAVLFVAVVVEEGVRRPGYDPAYHTISELTLGEDGWIQRANFLQVGVAMCAYAIGIGRALHTGWGAVLLLAYGAGLILSGLFLPDPVRGFPPEAEVAEQAAPSQEQAIHSGAGTAAFAAIAAAGLILAWHVSGLWWLFTVVFGLGGIWLMVRTARAIERNDARTGLFQRALVFGWALWVVVIGIHAL